MMKRFLPLVRLTRTWTGVIATLALSAILAPAPSLAIDDKSAAPGASNSATSLNAAPDASLNTAKNLARMNCGAQIEWTAPNGRSSKVAAASDQKESAAALIMDDDTVSSPLPEGQTTFVIKLPAAAILDRFTFVNENAEASGELKISVSNYRLPVASPKWVEVDGSIAFTRKRLFNLSMVGVEARYVKLSFQVEKAGRIASLGLYGGETLQRFAWRHEQTRPQISWVSNVGSTHQSSPKDQLNFNFANLYAQAHVVYVSSGALASAGRMIDDDTETGFHFAASDKQPTVVVELRGNERLRRVSALYKLHTPGRLDVYLLNDLPQGALQLDHQDPVASVTDTGGEGKSAVNFDPRGARYVALRWTPAYLDVLQKPTALAIDGKATVDSDPSDARGAAPQWTPNDVANSAQGFEIAEIDAFGNAPLAMLMLGETPDFTTGDLDSVQMPGEGPPDVSNGLGTIAIPPVLPTVSP